MTEIYFEILRPGINTTMQDNGRYNLYHIGVTISGAMDQRNHNLANALVGNKPDIATIEFAYQGPLLKLKNGTIIFAISGNVLFNIIRKNSTTEKGVCYKNYVLNDEDKIDIISTKKSVYGYLSVNNGFKIEKIWNSYSTNTKAKIGPNSGKKYSINEKIFINKNNLKRIKERKLNYVNLNDNIIRVIKGTNFNYFSDTAIINFTNSEYLVTKLTDRMGMRLEGPRLKNIINANIKSEGLIRGTIQVPADGNPIILLSDHGTIGGYPKIAVVISVDLDKISQMTPGTKIKFKEVNLKEAENLYKNHLYETKHYLEQIKYNE